MSAMTVIDYVNYKNPQGVVNLLQQNGVRAYVPDQAGLPMNANLLNGLLVTKGEEILRQVAEIHPDKEMILAYTSQETPEMPMSFCGPCAGMGVNGERFSNMIGHEPAKPAQSKISMDPTVAITALGFCFMITALIVSK